jgi:hypothetical protein
MNLQMKNLLKCLLLLPIIASAADLKNVVQDVASSKMSMVATIYGKDTSVVYVGTDNLCESVSIMWTPQRIENFRVCHGEMQSRNTVSPAWDDSNSRPILKSVVGNAILYGHANQNDNNGYMISARTLGTVSADCKTIEVIVSYDGDLVDRGIKEICGKQER